MDDEKREFLRHTLATLAYRGSKPLHDAPASFATFRASEGSRSPVEILAHIGNLLEWALSLMRDQQTWHDSGPLSWDQEVLRFYATLKQVDDYLASGKKLGVPAEKLFQGPIADALTHVGQICMLRRLAGEAMRGENYFKADIVTGRVGSEQQAARHEFD